MTSLFFGYGMWCSVNPPRRSASTWPGWTRGQERLVRAEGWRQSHRRVPCRSRHAWCFLQVMGVSPSSLDGLYWLIMENPKNISHDGSMVLLYMVLHRSHKIYPSHVSIDPSTMDPSWVWFRFRLGVPPWLGKPPWLGAMTWDSEWISDDVRWCVVI